MNKVILVGRITEDLEVRYMNNEDQTVIGLTGPSSAYDEIKGR